MDAPRVLVSYGTKNGSTAGIADMIASALHDEGVSTDVRAAGTVRDVAGYDAVILGGALYSGRWHSDARRFARRHTVALRGRPTWIFSSGPLDHSADTSGIPPVPQAAEAVRQLDAREHVTFGGQLTEQVKGFVGKAMVRNGRGGDFRNPDRIAAWARGIAANLRAGDTTTA